MRPTLAQRFAPTLSALGTLGLVRLVLAGMSFLTVVVLFLLMDFGDRGYHLERAYASNITPTGEAGYDLKHLRVLTRCVGYVRANYVDPTRADPRKMLVAALDDVERTVPALIADAKLGQDGRARAITVRVGDREQAFDLGKVNDLYTMNWKLLDIFEFAAPLLPSDVDAREVEYSAVNGMLRTLDPHSLLLTPHIYREMKLGTSGKFGGLGIVIGSQDGQLMIQSIMEGTPASGAGLKSGDRIVQIGAESTVNMALDDAVKRLRGDPGTTVTIWILRKGWAEPKRFKLVRSNITVASVTANLVEGTTDIAYARVKNFQESTAKDLEAALDRLEGEAKAAGKAGLVGLVLDLRDNPGGLLDQAINVSDLFLSDGTIVTTVGSGSRSREEKIATGGARWKSLPMVVLVSAGSASASEIVAGALRNNNRAVILGTRTFGKGSVQVIYDVDETKDDPKDDVALKLTVAQYLTPGDESIQSVGITPHVELVPVAVDKDHLDLNLDAQRGERSLSNHLENQARVKVHEPDARLAHLVSSDDAAEKGFELRLATRMVVEAGRPDVTAFVERARPIFALAEREQTQRLVEALSKRDIDWNDGPTPKKPDVVAEVTAERDRDGKTEAGQKVTLKLRVTNRGREPLFRVRARTRSPVDAFDGRDFVLGRVPPGESREGTVSVDVSRATPTQIAPVSVDVYAGKATTALPEVDVRRAEVEILGLPRPRFAYTLQVVDPSGNGDGIANEGETVQVRIRLENVGKGAAQKTLATLQNAGGEEIFLTDGREWLDRLAPGEMHELSFTMEVKDGAAQAISKLDLEVTDTILRQRMTARLEVPFGPKGGARPEERDERYRVKKSATPVRIGASGKAPPLGTLSSGALVHVDGAVGEWLRVPLTRGGTGWMSREDLEPAAEADAVPNRVELQLERMKAQPFVLMTKNVAQSTTEARAKLEGEATFPHATGAVELYIFRGDEKIYYLRARPDAAGRVPFVVDAALTDGLNRFTVTARTERELVFREPVIVYRHR